MDFSNSSLVSHVRLSPNHSGQRIYPLTRITVHCTAGRASVEGLGEIFANPSRQASSQYGIGEDGRVGMYVEEKNRSWCSSSYDNDERSITIEASSDATEPFAMNPTVYARIIDLCTDICQRYGKQEQKTATRKRVAAYCRVSTDKDAQKESLENQMEAFQLRLEEHADWDLVGIYADEGLSGTSVKHRAKFLKNDRRL